MGVLKFPLGLLQFWGSITLRENFRLGWGLKQSCNLHWELSNDMLHVTCTQRNRGDSWLLMVGNQIANLTLSLFFGHNLWILWIFIPAIAIFWSCEPISDIYIPRAFQWYKEISIQWIFIPAITFWKFRSPLGTPTPKMGIHLRVWGFIPSHPFALPRAWNRVPGLPSWPAPLQAFTLVVNPALGLRQLFKCRILHLLIYIEKHITI
jgi:hypothetical protein